MATTTSIHSLFLLGKDEFAKQLRNYSLPCDSLKVQSMITEYLNQLLDSKGDFRNNLSESEDHILQAAMNLLEQQQVLTSTICSTVNVNRCNVVNKQFTSSLSNKDAGITLGGTALGGVVGTFFGTWGAVLGAVAGTAISYYCLVVNKQNNKKSVEADNKQYSKIDVDAFLSIMSNICKSIDDVIEAYRVQVQKIRNHYDQQDKPNLSNDYSILMNNLLALHKVYSVNKENIPAKVANAIEILFDSLENYDVKIEDGKIVRA